MLLDLVAFHPALAWFSTYNEVFPAVPWVSVLSRLHDLAPFDGAICRRARWFPRPTESYRMLDRCTGSRFTLRRNLEPRDALPEVQMRFRETVARQLWLQGKSRFVCKYTGLPRIRFVRKLIPDAGWGTQYGGLLVFWLVAIVVGFRATPAEPVEVSPRSWWVSQSVGWSLSASVFLVTWFYLSQGVRW